MHSETGKDLTPEQAKRMPIHLIFPMYVDMIFSFTNKKLISDLGFSPVDEPLLKEAFENNKSRTTKEFGKDVLLPVPELLLAMKLHSILHRDKTHKRLKDFCDIVALCIYSELEMNDIILKSKNFVSKKVMARFRKMNFEEECRNGSKILNLNYNTVNSVILRIKEK